MVIKKLYKELINILGQKQIDIAKVERAFKTADELHRTQVRKSGLPYIVHPLEVALILSRLNFGIDIVCAALLHDTIEDCDYTLENLKEDFGENVAQIVDTVSAIDNQKYIYNDGSIYESEKFVKFSAEEQTFQKLISLGKKNPLGLYVKLADRLNNLITIDIFDRYKQLEKVKETKRWVLPLAETLNARYFYDEISNECFKISSGKDSYYLNQYNFYVSSAQSNFDNTKLAMKEILSYEIFKDVLSENIKEYQVFNFIKEKIPTVNVSNITQGQIMKVPTHKIYLLIKNNLKGAVNDFLNKLPNFEQVGLKLIGESTGKISGQAYFKMIDKYKNIYLIYFMTPKEYFEYKIGSTEGQRIDLLDEENTHKISTTFIKVRTRSNELKYLPEGSTVLDFAFKIHQDIGLAFRYALLNNGKTKMPPYTVLNDNDKVEIIVERNKYDEMISNADIRWFAYVETDLAKKVLIKHFEHKIK